MVSFRGTTCTDVDDQGRLAKVSGQCRKGVLHLINEDICVNISNKKWTRNDEPCAIRHQSAARNTSVHNTVLSYAYASI